MHDTARLSGSAFFRVYGDLLDAPRILDVGSLDVNGTLRPLIPEGSEYVGVDVCDGMNVDVVLEHPHQLPFDGASFDLAVSSSCLEHDPQFWSTFCEIARVVKPGGFLYISVPSNGPYHAYPVDCWRFYGDAASALASWCNRQTGPGVVVVENFMVLPRKEVWVDNVMVFGVPPVPARDSMRAVLRDVGVATT